MGKEEGENEVLHRFKSVSVSVSVSVSMGMGVRESMKINVSIIKSMSCREPEHETEINWKYNSVLGL